MQISTLRKDGWISIPNAVADAANIQLGDKLELYVENGEMVFRKLTSKSKKAQRGAVIVTVEATSAPNSKKAKRTSRK